MPYKYIGTTFSKDSSDEVISTAFENDMKYSSLQNNLDKIYQNYSKLNRNMTMIRDTLLKYQYKFCKAFIELQSESPSTYPLVPAYLIARYIKSVFQLEPELAITNKDLFSRD